MNRKEFKTLLDLLDKKQISNSEWQVFSNREEAQSTYSHLKTLRENASYDEVGFNPWFKQKVMGKIYELGNNAYSQSLDEILSRMMSKVMLAGTLAIVTVLLLLYVYHGQVGVDTLTGIEQDSEINFISSLFNEY
jgi:hypothetical protein